MPAGRISHLGIAETQPLPVPAAAPVLVPSGTHRPQLEIGTMDIIVLAITAIFFALALAYVAVCEKL